MCIIFTSAWAHVELAGLTFAILRLTDVTITCVSTIIRFLQFIQNNVTTDLNIPRFGLNTKFTHTSGPIWSSPDQKSSLGCSTTTPVVTLQPAPRNPGNDAHN
jgi:hypothetical protein